MIDQYRLKLTGQGLIPQSWAYRLYAWLLEQVPEEEAALFHDQQHAISQYLDHGVWTVNLLTEQAAEAFCPVLEDCSRIELSGEKLCVEERSSSGALDASAFLQAKDTRRYRELLLASPIAFKQAGRYTIFPKEELLIQSVVRRWNECFPEFLLEDDQMLEAMLQGVHMTDYRLNSCRYQLKNVYIPAFSGRLTLEARLPMVLQELWNSLLLFSQFSGLGIKTTLGMGGIQLPEGRFRAENE